MCSPTEIQACERFLRDLKRQGSPDFPYIFDATRAERIQRWFGICRQTRGVEQGKPISLQPWQVFDLSNIYGWVSVEDGSRRFSRTYNKRARGNFKSTEKSAQCLYHMCADAIYPPYKPELAIFENDPEVECAAVDRDQAKRVFGDAKKIAEASPEIRKRLIIPRANPVRHRTRGGQMRALSKETRNKDSGAPSYYCLDEYHAHMTSMIYDLGLNSFGKRPQALLDVITTAGDDAENKPCYREEEYARRVVSGEIVDERYFVMIRELPEGADVHDKALWVMANPCLRYPNEYSKFLLRQISDEYNAAYGSNDPVKIRMFLTRRMCQWQTGSVNRYLDEQQMALAKAAQVAPYEFAKLTDGRECYCGFDLAKRIDLSGAAAVFLLDDGRIAIKAVGFMPENRAMWHEKNDRLPYIAWAKDGHCILTPGDVTNNDYVYNWFCAGEREHGWRIAEIDYDGANATDLAIKICEARNNDDFCVEISQGTRGQNLPVKGFRELMMQGKIVICENPLFITCLSNAVEEINSYGDVKLSKKHRSDSERIDPVAAMMNALARVLVRRENPTLADRLEQGWTM